MVAQAELIHPHTTSPNILGTETIVEEEAESVRYQEGLVQDWAFYPGQGSYTHGNTQNTQQVRGYQFLGATEATGQGLGEEREMVQLSIN